MICHCIDEHKMIVSLCLTKHNAMNTYWGSGGIAPRILWPRRHIEVGGQFHAQAALSPGKEPPGTHWIGGWVGCRAGVETVSKRKIPSPRSPNLVLVHTGEL